jgi:hypothetical protein
MLSIELQDKTFFAIRMGNLLWMEYNGSGLLMLRFSTHTIHVQGRGLTPLYEELLQLHCRRITVQTDDDDAPGLLVVTKVTVTLKSGRDND